MTWLRSRSRRTLLATVAFCIPVCSPTIAQQPFCTDFDDSNLNTFAPCPQRANVSAILSNTQTQDPQSGPSGTPTDLYLHMRDLSGASLVCATGPYAGDWSTMQPLRCAALCFDIRVFEDACVPSIPACASNGGWIPITPQIIIQGGTSGDLRAIFNGNQTITDNLGPNSGWHRVCAPIAFLNPDGTLPSNNDGAWVMSVSCDILAGSPCPNPTTPPDSAWNDLIANVAGLHLPIDFTGNPAERAGYDNICIRNDVCPQVVLSVTFDSVEAERLSPAQVLVRWRTSFESQTVAFAVEKSSTEHGPFALLGTVAAVGGGDYEVVDGAAESTVFYRIVEHTVDGSGAASPVVNATAVATGDSGRSRSGIRLR